MFFLTGYDTGILVWDDPRTARPRGCCDSDLQVSVAGLRQHLPGPHPDENLYATSIMPLGARVMPLGLRQWEKGQTVRNIYYYVLLLDTMYMCIYSDYVCIIYIYM